MILLTGATGNCGREILQLFKSMNVPLRILVRNPEKIDHKDWYGLEIQKGDLQDRKTVLDACKGVDKAFLLMANIKEQASIEKIFIDTAKAAGVNHVVKLSAIGADSHSPVEMSRIHAEVEEYLMKSGMHYTNIRPSHFMQNILHSADSIIAEGKFYLPLRSTQTGMIDIRDVAEVVVEALSNNQHLNKTYTITGPTLLSFYDVAEQLTTVLDREIQYIDITIDEFKEQVRHWSPDDSWFVDAVSELFAHMANDSDAKVTDTFVQITGKSPRSFTEFLKDNIGAFS